MKINTVSIVGCGWFGLPLAKHLFSLGYQVSGSKRAREAADALGDDGIQGFTLDLDNQAFNGVVLDEQKLLALPSETKTRLMSALHTDAIVINIPPALRKKPDAYLKRLNFLALLMGKHRYKRVIFISTTGVYPSTGEVMAESDAVAHSPSSDILLQAEHIFVEKYAACVVRFSGLIGPGRHPGRFLARKTGVSGADLPVNLVHLDDCVDGVSYLLSQDKLSSVYNLCAPIHPTKKMFYTCAAEDLSLEAPQFDSEPQIAKVIDGSKISNELGYCYRHNSPLDMLSKCRTTT